MKQPIVNTKLKGMLGIARNRTKEHAFLSPGILPRLKIPDIGLPKKLLTNDLGAKQHHSKESCPVRPIPAHRAGLYGLTETRQLSDSNSKPAFIPVHRTGFSAGINK